MSPSPDDCSSDDSSPEAMFSTLCEIVSSVPMPRLARPPVDHLEELSARIVSIPSYNGRLLWFFKAYTALGKEGCMLVARGVLNLPPETAACHKALSSIVLPHRKKARTEAKQQLLKTMEPPDFTIFGTPQDNRVRRSFSFVIAFIFQQIIVANDALGLTSINTSFSCPVSKEPSISLLHYFQRIMRYVPATTDSFIVALIFIDRILSFNPEVRLTIYNAHRLFITAILVASKYLDDFFYTNTFFSKVGGISPEEMNRLEIEFLAAIRFSLFVDLEVFHVYRESVMNLVGVCNVLPLDAPVPSLAPDATTFTIMRSSFSIIDDMFCHIEKERRRLISLPPSTVSFLGLMFPSTLTRRSSFRHKPGVDHSYTRDEFSLLESKTGSHHGSASSAKVSSFKNHASSSSKCSSEASSCSSASSRSSCASHECLPS